MILIFKAVPKRNEKGCLDFSQKIKYTWHLTLTHSAESEDVVIDKFLLTLLCDVCWRFALFGSQCTRVENQKDFSNKCNFIIVKCYKFVNHFYSRSWTRHGLIKSIISCPICIRLGAPRTRQKPCCPCVYYFYLYLFFLMHVSINNYMSFVHHVCLSTTGRKTTAKKHTHTTSGKQARMETFFDSLSGQNLVGAETVPGQWEGWTELEMMRPCFWVAIILLRCDFHDSEAHIRLCVLERWELQGVSVDRPTNSGSNGSSTSLYIGLLKSFPLKFNMEPENGLKKKKEIPYLEIIIFGFHVVDRWGLEPWFDPSSFS